MLGIKPRASHILRQQDYFSSPQDFFKKFKDLIKYALVLKPSFRQRFILWQTMNTGQDFSDLHTVGPLNV